MSSRNTTKLSTIRRSRVTRAAIMESVEMRQLMSVSLTGGSSFSGSVGDIGVTSNNSFAAVLTKFKPDGTTLKGSSAFRFSTFQVFEYAPNFLGRTLDLFPSTTATPFTVGAVNSLTVGLYNTAITGTGNFAGQPGDFNVYIASDSTTSITKTVSPVTYQGDPQGVGFAPLNGQLGTNATSSFVGTGHFTAVEAGLLGYSNYTFTGLSSAVQATIAGKLNTNTALRLIVTPADTSIAADWEGNFNATTTPTLALDVEQAVIAPHSVAFSASSYSVNENAGTASITVNRTIGSNFTDTGTTLNYATTNGTAIAGTNYTATSGVLTFAAGATSATITVPVTDLHPQFGNKAFTLTLSSPSANTIINGTGTTTVTIIDTDAINLSQSSTTSSTIRATGPRGGNYFDVQGIGTGTTVSVNAAFGALDYNVAGGGYEYTLPSGQQISSVNTLSLDSFTGFPVAFFATSGPVNVYIVSDTTTDDSTPGGTTLQFDTTDVTGEGLNGQLGTALLLGQTTFYAGETTTAPTAHTLINSDPAAIAALISAINNGQHFRLAVTPGNQTVAVDLEGQFVATGGPYAGQLLSPKLTVNAYTAAPLPAWLQAGSAATWNASTHQLHVTGAATIIADPGSDVPVITADTAASDLRVNPTGTNVVHLGGLLLSNGAKAEILSLGAARSDVNHRVVVLPGTQLSIDGTSKLDVLDNDVIVTSTTAGAATTALSLVSNYAKTGQNVDPIFTGPGVTSSVAATDGTGAGQLRYAVGVVQNNLGGSTLFDTFDTVSVGLNDVLVKFTYFGDADLNGLIDDTDFFLTNDGYGNSRSGWVNGDFDYSGAVDDTDFFLINNAYGSQGSTLRASSVKLTGTGSSLFSGKELTSPLDLATAASVL